VVLAGAVLLLGATALVADVAKPPRPVQTPVTMPADINFTGKVQIEFVEKGDEVTLLVKKAWVTEKKEKAETPDVKNPKADKGPSDE
jgi:hypothetical protein